MRWLLICIALIASALHAKDYGNVIVSEVTSIYDADTFRVNIKDYLPIVGERIPVRVKGIDAPEIKGKCEAEKVAARKAKQFTVQALRSAKTIELRSIERGKYFRILADVYTDDKNLADDLIKAGHARAYDGGKRLGWCDAG
jgi:endonuclease YncB( thermonuclease family)